MKQTYIKSALSLALTLAISACHSTDSMILDYGVNNDEVKFISAEQAMNSLVEAPICCSNYSDIEYKSVNKSGKYDFTISGKSGAIELSSGKTFVKGIRFPDVLNDINVVISSPIGRTVFVPTVMLLDEGYNPVKIFGEETINYQNGSLLNVDRFIGKFKISKEALRALKIRYLLIFTTDDALSKETMLEAVDPKIARLGRAQDVRMYSDQAIKHSAIGAVRVAMSFQNSVRGKFDHQEGIEPGVFPVMPVISENENAVKRAGKSQVLEKTDISKASATLIESVENSGQIQPETEAMYIRLIEQAVRTNKLNQAIKLVEEGEKAGSGKVRDVFFEALKKYQ